MIAASLALRRRARRRGSYGGFPIGDVNPLRWLSAKFYSVQAIRAKINI